MSATEPASVATNLVNLMIALLAPMFLWSTDGDIRLAHIAAAQTLNEYRVTNRLSLFTVAKIIAFDIDTLSSLSLSMYEDVSMLLALRLRGNANSLDRSGERNRQALEQASRPGAPRLAEEPVAIAIAEAEQRVREAMACTHPEAPLAETQVVADRAPVAESATEEQQQAVRTGVMSVLPADELWRDMERIEGLIPTVGDPVLPAPAIAAE